MLLLVHYGLNCPARLADEPVVESAADPHHVRARLLILLLKVVQQLLLPRPRQLHVLLHCLVSLGLEIPVLVDPTAAPMLLQLLAELAVTS
jgi:hypothetical protein